VEDGSLSDIVLIAFILSLTQSIAGLVIERFSQSEEHSVQELLAALITMLQDEMQQTRETIKELGVADDDQGE